MLDTRGASSKNILNRSLKNISTSGDIFPKAAYHHMSHEIIQYKGKDILYVDYSQCRNIEESLTLIESSIKLLKSRPGKTLVLVNVNKVTGSREFMKKSKELNESTRDKVAKRAVIGVTGMKKVLLMGFNKFAKTAAVPFDSKEAAMEFLVAENS